MSGREISDSRPEAAPGKALISSLLAWLVPGGGHFYLGRRRRAVVFFVIVLAGALIGAQLDGNLYRVRPGQPLTLLGTFAAMGMGAPYFFLRFAVGYAGDIVASGYEYGTAFLLTAGLMNWLLVLDCWDIALGRKE